MAFTYFFRDYQTLDMICQHALPQLRTRKFINIWDAGCAMGPEPYTLSMMLRERIGSMYFRNVRIRATDIDGSNLFEDIIGKGVYPREQVERIPEDLFHKYFIPFEPGSSFQVSEEIRKSILFEKHDLLSLQPVGKEFGLILCKNVLLHFTERQRIQVLEMFHESLMDDGFLAMEQTQKLPGELEQMFQPVVSNARLFRKIPAGDRV